MERKSSSLFLVSIMMMMMMMMMMMLLGSAYASVTCFNKSNKDVDFDGTGFIGGSVNVKANSTMKINLVPFVGSLFCTVRNNINNGVSSALKLLTTSNVACVDVGTKVTLYACDKEGNIKGKPLCQPF